MSISSYTDKLTTRGIVDGITKIKLAFPTLPAGFYDILSDRLKGNEFTDKRLFDSINNVIDTCIYPIPTIAQFISWDKRIKMFTYNQMLKMAQEANMGPGFWDNYKSFQFKDRPARVWIHVNDVAQYNISE